MKEFRIKLMDRPGELDRVARTLAAHDANVKALAAVVSGPQPVIGVVGDDEEKIRAGLEEDGFTFEEHDLLMVSLADQPGELAKITSKLADGLVNVESIYLITRAGLEVQFGLTVDNMQKARHALD